MAQNHYEILELAPGASPEEIRTAYRKLARKFHPDVNPSPDATRRFQMISESYAVLSDPERKKHYDAIVEMEQRARTAPPRPQQPPPRNDTPPRANPRPQAARPTPPPKEPPKPPPPDPRRLLQLAQHAFVNRRFSEAEAHAQLALKHEQNAQVWALLGDIALARADLTRAIGCYTSAAQLEPNNPRLRAQLERLIKRAEQTQLAQSATRSLGLLAGCIGVVTLIFMARFIGGPHPAFGAYFPWISSWNGSFVLLLFSTGTLLGLVMAAGHVTGRMEHSLILRGAKHGLSAGTLISIISALWFLGGALAYFFLGAANNSYSAGLSRAILAVLGATVAFSFTYPNGAWQTLLFGGNVLFIGLMAGWFLHDQVSAE